MRVQLISQQSTSFEVPACNWHSILPNTLNARLYETRKWYGGWYDRQPYLCTCHAERRPSSSKRRDWVAERACYPQDKGPYLSLAFPALITRQHGFGYGPHLEVGSTWAARSRMISYGRPTVSVSVPTLRAIAALTRPSGMRGTPPDRRCATLLFPSSCAALSRSLIHPALLAGSL
jgi:hypothetical protein